MSIIRATRPSLCQPLLLAAALASCLTAQASWAQGTLEDYRRAERFVPWNAEKPISSALFEPNWVDGGDTFWYRRTERDGSRFVLVDPARRSKRPVFDPARLLGALPAPEGAPYDPRDPPFRTFKIVQEGNAIHVAVAGATWLCDLRRYECSKHDHLGPAPHELPSPDGSWIAYVQDHDVYVRSTATGELVQLSKDGEPRHDYGDGYFLDFLLEDDDEPSKPGIHAIWSPDSRRLFTHRIDRRKTKDTHLLQSVVPRGSMRTLHHADAYPLPGDPEEEVPLAAPVVFDVPARRQVEIATPPLLEPLISWVHARGFWSKDGRKVYFVDTSRGYKTASLVEADAETGRARHLIEERSSTLVDHNIQQIHIVGDGSEIVWSSDRDGWNHLYLYDGKTGALKRQITSGRWVVRRVEHVDEEKRVLYFTAGGREPGRDPYLRHLYRVNLDGTGLRLLTPEDADHLVTFSPTGRFFVDVYSRVDTAPASVLRRSSDGAVVMELEKADLAPLLAMGWQFPEAFRALARDGKTDVYGVLFKPSNFDPSRRYPVVENIYSGPHTYSTPKHFPVRPYEVRSFFTSQSIAELGFVVVVMDGLGQNFRDRAFRDHQYRNLADAGLADRISALRQLAAQRPYLDLGRVGIFGFSAGGYAAARAVLSHPEFYKVAVASAGNHDHRMDKLSWNERWMGYPVGEHYEKQSNVADAARLRGKLLLTYGDLDTNVPPASTLSLVHALIRANKDFDMVVFPNRGHYLDDDPYFIRRRWDYFVRHLLGVEPPREYPLAKPENERDKRPQ